MIKLNIESDQHTPLYKQLIRQITLAIKNGSLREGDHLPSMNQLAAELGISRETAKKTYGILTEKGLLRPQQGKGFYVAEQNKNGKLSILVLFDKLSIYKQVLFNAFVDELGERADITILTHNQSIELFTYYLDQFLDQYDYYVITPHFPLDAETQQEALRQIARIPNRKLIMTDHWMREHKGHYGVVYQDFERDIYDGLIQGRARFLDAGCLKVITLPTSLYGSLMRPGIDRFCHEQGIRVAYYTHTPDEIEAGDCFLLLNSQLDWGLTELAQKIEERNLRIGENVFIISYNEFGLDELILGGLTTLSTDFRRMGQETARMILKRSSDIVHCPFSLIRRRTF